MQERYLVTSTDTASVRILSGSARIRHVSEVVGDAQLVVTSGGRITSLRDQRERITVWDAGGTSPAPLLDIPLEARHGWITSLHALTAGRLLIAFTDSKGHFEVRAPDGAVVLAQSSHWRTFHHNTLVEFDGAHVAVVARGKKVLVLPIPGHRPAIPAMEIRHHASVRQAAAAVVDGALYVLTRAADDVLRVWRPTTAERARSTQVPVTSLRDTRDTPYSHSLTIGSAGGRLVVASGAADTIVRCWDVDSGEVLMEARTARPVRAVAIGHLDGHDVLAAVCSDGATSTWRIADGTNWEAPTAALPKTSAANVSISSGRVRAASGGKDGVLRLHDIALRTAAAMTPERPATL
jgi:hypothetical protein